MEAPSVIDPRLTDSAKLAQYHLQFKPGTDIALFNGLANVIIEEGLYNKEFVEERTEDFEAFKQTVTKYTPDYVSEITGVPAEVIREVARGYAKAKNAQSCIPWASPSTPVEHITYFPHLTWL